MSYVRIIGEMEKTRLENDSLGKVLVTKDAYYGSHTARSLSNFPISGQTNHLPLIKAIVSVKKAAASVNHTLKLLDGNKAASIIQACNEILSDKFSDQFVTDVYQAGAGTSLNMNVNEVIANRANELLSAKLGTYKFIHPNDHVNMSQSTNDVIPVAIQIAILMELPALTKAIYDLEKALSKKSREFAQIVKSGRTHLQDALPLTLGNEFGAYAKAIKKDQLRVIRASHNLFDIGIGGTAVGTGLNSHPKYHRFMVKELSILTKLKLRSSDNLFESMQNAADFLDLSSCFRTLSQSLIRIGNDLRLLSSGPKTGLAEISLPAVQPGSSIMPGKVNPSIIEMLTMVCFQVIGFDHAILLASQAGQLELNFFYPLIVYNLLEQMKLLTNAISIFTDKCVVGIKVNKQMCKFWLNRGNGIAAILNPYLGYAKSAELVKESLKRDIPFHKLVLEKGLLTKSQVNSIFSIDKLTKPNIMTKQVRK